MTKVRKNQKVVIMYKISLNNLEFYSFHGFYQEENLIGNDFVVDMFVCLPDDLVENENLDSTLNYETLYSIVKEEMAIPRKLLESVVKSMANRVLVLNKNILDLNISLKKKHVPIEGMIGEACVTYMTGKG